MSDHSAPNESAAGARTPLVSVIIPNYRHAQFLEQRIRSVLEQTLQDFEVILLDDASPDNSLEVIARFTDPRIRLLVNERNSGSTFKQWNKGFSLARGRYVWIAESDDHAAPTLLARLVAVLEENPAVGIAYCQSWQIDGEGKITRLNNDWTNGVARGRWEKDFINNGRDECARYMYVTNTIRNASAVVFRKSVVEEAGGASEHFRLCGDWNFWVSILLRHGIAFLAEPLNYFRFHESSVRHRLSAGPLGAREIRLVRQKIRRVVDVPVPCRRKVVQQFSDEWSKALFSHARPVGLGQHLLVAVEWLRLDVRTAIYLLRDIPRVAWSVLPVPGVVRKVLRNCFIRPMKKAGILTDDI